MVRDVGARRSTGCKSGGVQGPRTSLLRLLLFASGDARDCHPALSQQGAKRRGALLALLAHFAVLLALWLGLSRRRHPRCTRPGLWQCGQSGQQGLRVTRASWVALRLLQAPAQSVGGLPRAERAPLGRLARHLPPQPRLCCWSSKGLLANLANCWAGLCTAWVPSVYHHSQGMSMYI